MSRGSFPEDGGNTAGAGADLGDVQPVGEPRAGADRRRWTQDPPMLWVTLAGVVVVAGSLGVGVWQAVETRRAIEEAKEANRIAREALAGNDETTAAEIRPYVFAIPGNVYVVADGSMPEPRTIFRNSGKTFATKVRRSVGVTISPPLTPERENALGEGALEEGNAVLSPNGADSVVIRRGASLPAGSLELIRSENLRLYVLGAVEYTDVQGKPYWTTFCHFFSGEMADWGRERGGWGFASNQARYCTGHSDISRN